VLPSLVFVSVSDGVGVGIVVRGELVRGQHNIAGEFAHMPISLDGPRCGCGRSGCWQAYVSNLATLSRYFGRDLRLLAPDPREALPLTIEDLMARANGGDGKAIAAVQETARSRRPRRRRRSRSCPSQYPRLRGAAALVAVPAFAAPVVA